MARGDVQHIELTFGDIDELFLAPALDPFNGQFPALSGIEQLVAEPRPRAGATAADHDLPAGGSPVLWIRGAI
ncbi:MAG: hypothetical protein ACRDJW_14585 [Thermomicrobiales bacterium]